MKILVIGIICVLTCMSCSSDEESQNYPVGGDFIENEIQIRIIDTFKIETGTIKLDSIITSSTSRILLGSIIDDNFGHLTAQSYLQVKNSDFSIDSDAVYDSIGFIMNYDKYVYGDTTKVQTYKIHRILETFEPYEGDNFYNTSSLEYDPDSLGELSFTPRPNRDSDSLYVPMDDELGIEIFNKILDNDINNSDDFIQYFKGLTIIPDILSNNHILGFNVSTEPNIYGNSSMRLFYTVDDGDSEDNDYYIDFVISGSGKQFNEIETDLTGTAIDSFEDSETIISSKNTEDQIYTQAGTGISSRIEIPSIKKLNEISDDGTTLSAELTFSPLNGSYSDDKPLKDSLSVYIIDHKNRIIDQLTNLAGTNSYAVLNDDDNEFNQIYYSVDLSAFVEEISNSTYNLNYSLMIQFVDYNKTVDSAIIENDEMKLTVEHLNY